MKRKKANNSLGQNTKKNNNNNNYSVNYKTHAQLPEALWPTILQFTYLS